MGHTIYDRVLGEPPGQEQEKLEAVIQKVFNLTQGIENPTIKKRVNKWCEWMTDIIKEGQHTIIWEDLIKDLKESPTILDELTNNLPELREFREQLESEEITPLPSESETDEADDIFSSTKESAKKVNDALSG